MKNIITSLIFILCFLNIFSQSNNFTEAFKASYSENPNIPKGLLEAISYSKTHIKNIDTTMQLSCIGLPSIYGPMGLMNSNDNYFNNSAKLIAELTEIEIDDILYNPNMNISSYAKALSITTNNSKNIYEYLKAIKDLSDLPKVSHNQQFALDIELYSIILILQHRQLMSNFGYNTFNLDLNVIFGENLPLLSANKILITKNKIYDLNGNIYKSSCNDYPNSTWVTSPNFNSRSGVAITDVAIHTIQGYYASCISYFQGTSSNVSSHYVLRSIDGQVTQMVCEDDRAWHIGSENSYTIGLEHEGFVNDPSWYTDSMYLGSANLVKDITQSGYGINPLSTYKSKSQAVINSCYHVKGHVNFPNQTHTDPGVNWDWHKYYHLINDSLMFGLNTNHTGTFTDNGGILNPYNVFESYMTVISPPNADSINLTFTNFDLELDFDTMVIYDGIDTTGIFIGTFTGTISPGTIIGTSGSLAILFYSDCRLNNDGWEASWFTYLKNDELIINNILTPNSDGKNDTWNINKIDLISSCTISIFNRWGKLVWWQENSYNNQWTGKNLNGNLLPDGTYYYTIVSETQKYSGTLILIR